MKYLTYLPDLLIPMPPTMTASHLRRLRKPHMYQLQSTPRPARHRRQCRDLRSISFLTVLYCPESRWSILLNISYTNKCHDNLNDVQTSQPKRRCYPRFPTLDCPNIIHTCPQTHSSICSPINSASMSPSPPDQPPSRNNQYSSCSTQPSISAHSSSYTHAHPLGSS